MDGSSLYRYEQGGAACCAARKAFDMRYNGRQISCIATHDFAATTSNGIKIIYKILWKTFSQLVCTRTNVQTDLQETARRLQKRLAYSKGYDREKWLEAPKSRLVINLKNKKFMFSCIKISYPLYLTYVYRTKSALLHIYMYMCVCLYLYIYMQIYVYIYIYMLYQIQSASDGI
jgi:hypothetical protein